MTDGEITIEEKKEIDDKVIKESQRLVKGKTDITYKIDYFDTKTASEILKYLDQHINWDRKRGTKDFDNKRTSSTYGDEGVSYTVELSGGITIKKKVHPWSELPYLKDIKELLEKSTGMKFNFVVIQRYPKKEIGIDTHRDKELAIGSVIAGLSFGATRILTINNTFEGGAYRFMLYNGSAYILNPYTNDFNTHRIEPGTEDGIRISLTYRLIPV